MKVLTIVLTIISIFFLIAWKLCGIFAEKVPALGEFVKLFLWVWIIALIAAVVVGVLLIIKEFAKKKGE